MNCARVALITGTPVVSKFADICYKPPMLQHRVLNRHILSVPILDTEPSQKLCKFTAVTVRIHRTTTPATDQHRNQTRDVKHRLLRHIAVDVSSRNKITSENLSRLPNTDPF